MTQRFERNSNNAKYLLRDWGKRLEFILNDYFHLANLHKSLKHCYEFEIVSG